MMMQTEREMLRQMVREGNVDAFLPYADELYDHPRADRLRELAIDIATETDFGVQTAAILLFQEIVGLNQE